MLRVVVDRDRCCGSGQCVLDAPEVFDQRDEDGLVTVLDAEPPAGPDVDLRRVASLCPAGAIEVVPASAPTPEPTPEPPAGEWRTPR